MPPTGKSDHCVLGFKVYSNELNCVVDMDTPKLNFNKRNYTLVNDFILNNLKLSEVIVDVHHGDKLEYVNSLWNFFTLKL